TLLLAAVLSLSWTDRVLAQGTLRIGMTASDIPYTGGQTDNGFEGFRFVGYQIYEPLIAWDLTRGDRLAPLVPGLAESWEVRRDQPTKWVFKLRERLELEANRSYWDAKRRPKIDRLVLLPMPEPTTRLAALRSGQVDWIEVPPPDSIPQLKGGGFSITLNSYPHNWTHTLRLDK